MSLSLKSPPVAEPAFGLTGTDPESSAWSDVDWDYLFSKVDWTSVTFTVEGDSNPCPITVTRTESGGFHVRFTPLEDVRDLPDVIPGQLGVGLDHAGSGTFLLVWEFLRTGRCAIPGHCFEISGNRIDIVEGEDTPSMPSFTRGATLWMSLDHRYKTSKAYDLGTHINVNMTSLHHLYPFAPRSNNGNRKVHIRWSQHLDDVVKTFGKDSVWKGDFVSLGFEGNDRYANPIFRNPLHNAGFFKMRFSKNQNSPVPSAAKRPDLSQAVTGSVNPGPPQGGALKKAISEPFLHSSPEPKMLDYEDAEPKHSRGYSVDLGCDTPVSLLSSGSSSHESSQGSPAVLKSTDSVHGPTSSSKALSLQLVPSGNQSIDSKTARLLQNLSSLYIAVLDNMRENTEKTDISIAFESQLNNIASLIPEDVNVGTLTNFREQLYVVEDIELFRPLVELVDRCKDELASFQQRLTVSDDLVDDFVAVLTDPKDNNIEAIQYLFNLARHLAIHPSIANKLNGTTLPLSGALSSLNTLVQDRSLLVSILCTIPQGLDKDDLGKAMTAVRNLPPLSRDLSGSGDKVLHFLGSCKALVEDTTSLKRLLDFIPDKEADAAALRQTVVSVRDMVVSADLSEDLSHLADRLIGLLRSLEALLSLLSLTDGFSSTVLKKITDLGVMVRGVSVQDSLVYKIVNGAHKAGLESNSSHMDGLGRIVNKTAVPLAEEAHRSLQKMHEHLGVQPDHSGSIYRAIKMLEESVLFTGQCKDACEKSHAALEKWESSVGSLKASNKLSIAACVFSCVVFLLEGYKHASSISELYLHVFIVVVCFGFLAYFNWQVGLQASEKSTADAFTAIKIVTDGKVKVD